jgi:STE24 endopeptidase
MNTYLILILIILIGTYLLDLIVDIVNARHVSTELPQEFKGIYDEAKYKKAQEYLEENTWFGIIGSSITLPITLVFILFGGFDFVDRMVRSLNVGDILTGLLFSGTILFASQLLRIPLSIHETFVIEEKYGFNRTTPRVFILDILKSWLLLAIIGGLILSTILWIFEKIGPLAWVYVWLAVTVFQVFLMFLAPVLIMPLFNKFVPIEEGELKKEIEGYAGLQRFKIKGVFKMDGSKRSTKTNAFFTGFGRFRRIVLFDTLIERHSLEELVSVIAHEMGHYKKGHLFKSIIVSILTSGLMFYILSLFINNRGLFDAFKMQETSIYASLFFFGFLYTPIDMIITVFTNALSRRHEYEADTHAVQTYPKPEALILALKKLSAENLSNLTPHHLKVFLDYSHPPVLDRIRSIRGKIMERE